MEETNFESSKLGTLDHWEEVYEAEIENFNDYGDEGEVWFGFSIVKKVVNWIKKNTEFSKDAFIVDIGCGNGYTCLQLAEAKYKNVYGIDYSKIGIKLADSIAKKSNVHIKYVVVDVLDKDQFNGVKFDIAIDKGTYDAIALNPDNPMEKRILYKEFVRRVLKENGTFIITSCNWTYEELVSFFTKDQEFDFVEEIKAAVVMSFGGQTGSTTTTLVFRKRSLNEN